MRHRELSATSETPATWPTGDSSSAGSAAERLDLVLAWLVVSHERLHLIRQRESERHRIECFPQAGEHRLCGGVLRLRLIDTFTGTSALLF